MRKLKFKYLWQKQWYFVDMYEHNTSAAYKLFESRHKTSEWLQFTNRHAKGDIEIYLGDIVKIHLAVDFIGEVKQRDGGQFYIDHKSANLKYEHQIHCEICETSSPLFFLDFFDPYQISVIGNVYTNPELLNQ